MLLLGCQGPSSGAEKLTVKDPLYIDLPTHFDESLERAFQANPRQTAQRILRAHDGFSRAGPVTTSSVKDYIRLEMSAHRARFISDILSSDLNGDGLITMSEFAVLKNLPNGYKKARRLEDMFDHDENKDGQISLIEAFNYAERLNNARIKSDISPIGTYLMLFDSNADGIVLRSEVTNTLRAYISDDRRRETALRGTHALP